MNNPFKPGDFVECIDSSPRSSVSPDITVGRVYRVIDVPSNRGVTIINDSGNEYALHSDRFNLVIRPAVIQGGPGIPLLDPQVKAEIQTQVQAQIQPDPQLPYPNPAKEAEERQRLDLIAYKRSMRSYLYGTTLEDDKDES